MNKTFYKLRSYLSIMHQLFITDLTIFKQYIVQDSINIIIWFSCITVIVGYAYPAMGMPSAYGTFFAFTLIASEGYWRIWPSCFSLVADLDGDRTIDYLFTLPMPSWLIFVEGALFHAFKTLLFLGITLPLATLLMWGKIEWQLFSPGKFCLIMTIFSLFNGFFYILLSTITDKVEKLRLVGIRIILPMNFLGATEFPWHIVYAKLSPALAYFLLLNPLVYAMEGVHAAALGQDGFLSFWLCAASLASITTLCAYVGIRRFKKQLDMV